MPYAFDFHKLLSDASTLKVEDEDGDSLLFELRDGASDADLAALAERHIVNTPDCLDALLRTTNGGSIWTIELVGTNDGSGVVPDRSWIAINNWGNGDFDWIVCSDDPDYAVGNIVFYSHESGKHAKIADTLEDWLQNAMNEIIESGTLMHPYDFQYCTKPTSKGLYRRVYEMMKS